MKNELHRIKQALEEHLGAINENTSEIEVLFDYLNQIENKIDKVSQRLDLLQLNHGDTLEKPIITPLNQIEKKIFLILYTEEMPFTAHEIAERSRLDPVLVPEYISSLIGKGIPLIRSFSNNQVFFKLEPAFKEQQAKENLVNLSLQSFIE